MMKKKSSNENAEKNPFSGARRQNTNEDIWEEMMHSLYILEPKA